MNPILQKAISFLYGAIRLLPWLGTALGPTATDGIDLMEAVQPSLADLMGTKEWAAFVGALGAALDAQARKTAALLPPVNAPMPDGTSAKPIAAQQYPPAAIFPWDHR